MDKDKIDYIKEFRNLFSVEYIVIKTDEGIKKIENASVFWDPEKIYILAEDDIMYMIPIDSFIKIKYTKNTTKNISSMIVYQFTHNYPELFSKRKYTDTEVG